LQNFFTDSLVKKYFKALDYADIELSTEDSKAFSDFLARRKRNISSTNRQLSVR
jgi:hypothetical protein